MEDNKEFTDLMSEEEFIKALEERNLLRDFTCVSKFKSIRRAMRRGKIGRTGVIYPKRPFHNRASTSKRTGVHSREMNQFKKKIYENYKSSN